MFKKYNYKSFFFGLSFLLFILILYLLRGVYWRPYNDTFQEAVISSHAHGMALANFAGLGVNPISGRDIDLETSQIRNYNHWPNGFFLVLAVAIKLFGNTENVGRSVALFFTVSGTIMLAWAFCKNMNLLWLPVIWILISPLGRDALSFVFADASLIFWIGCLGVSVALTKSGPRLSSVIFYISSILAPVFIHTIVIYVFAAVWMRFLYHRRKRQLVTDLIFAICGAAIIFYFLSLSDTGQQSGLGGLINLVLSKMGVTDYTEEYKGIWSVVLYSGMRLFNNLGVFLGFLPLAWFYLYKKQAGLAYFLPVSILGNFLLGKQFVTHYFSTLPVFIISTVTLFSGVEYFFYDRINYKKYRTLVLFKFINARLEYWQAGCLVFFLMGISAYTQIKLLFQREYMLDAHIAKQRENLMQIKKELASLPYNTFDLPDTVHERMVQFYLGDKVIERLNLKQKKAQAMIYINSKLIKPKYSIRI